MNGEGSADQVTLNPETMTEILGLITKRLAAGDSELNDILTELSAIADWQRGIQLILIGYWEILEVIAGQVGVDLPESPFPDEDGVLVTEQDLPF